MKVFNDFLITADSVQDAVMYKSLSCKALLRHSQVAVLMQMIVFQNVKANFGVKLFALYASTPFPHTWHSKVFNQCCACHYAAYCANGKS